ncbi:MAG: hypothetical protein ACUVQG_07350 [Thermogutta sp.]
MDFERLRNLRFEYEDQFVVVEGNRPELLRFKGKVGRVKTVNCNGRALVQFDSGADRGWYDIDLDFLRVVDPPEVNTPVGSPTGTSTDKPSQAPEYRPSALELARKSKQQFPSGTSTPLQPQLPTTSQPKKTS